MPSKAFDNVYKLRNIIDVSEPEYGAGPMRTAAQNAAAFNAAVAALPNNGSKIWIPGGDFAFDATFDLFRAGVALSFDIFGAGMFATKLLWQGSTSGVAVKIRRAVRFFFGHLRIENDVAEGTTKGLQITSEASSGSDTGPATITNLRVVGFNENVSIGEAAGNSASELTFTTLEVADCTYGVILRGANSLTNKFVGLAGSGCGTVLEATSGGPDCVWIYGGSASNSTVQDFAFREAGVYGIYGFRSEGAERFCTIGPDGGGGASSPSTVEISGCRVANTAAADNRAIRLNKAGHYRLHANTIADGHVYINSGNVISGSLTMEDNSIVSTTDLEVAASSYNWRVRKRGNTDSATGAGNFWPSGEFYYTDHTSGRESGPELELKDDFLGDVIADQWNTRVGSDGACVAAAVLASQVGGWIRMTTGANATTDYANNGTMLEHARNWQPDRTALSMEIKFKVNATDIAIFFGFKDTSGGAGLANGDMPFTLAAGDALTSNAVDAFGVLYDQAADTDNFWGVGVANNVDAAKQNFAVAPSANVWETWRIEYRGDGAYFYRNDILVGSKMSGPVTASVVLTPCVCVFSRTASNRNIDIDYIRVTGGR